MISRHDTLSRTERSERIALALMLGLGALLMLIASNALSNELPFSAKRTDRFNAVLKQRTAVRIDNISGDIVASPGAQFAVAATISVSAPTQKRADEVLGKTMIREVHDDDGYALEMRWPDSRSYWYDGGRRHGEARCEDCRINARYEVTLPPGVTATLKTVNGEVTVRDVDGELDLSSVNGNVRVTGTRRSLKARTINGRVEAAAAVLAPSASWDCRTVNGSVTLTFPKDAKFDLTASAMSGAIASTFPLPARTEPDALPVVRQLPKERNGEPEALGTRRRVVVRNGDDEDLVVDLREVEREIERSSREVERAMRELERSSVLLSLPLGRSYSGSIGRGGGTVHATTLNGTITVLAAGTLEADAKPLVSPRKVFRKITVPPMIVMSPRIVRAPVAPEAPAAPAAQPAPRPVLTPRAPAALRPMHPQRALPGDEESIVLGEVSGDFLSTTASANYEIGKVSGRVRILTHSGEIHVESAGAGADLKTYGGDINIGAVGGELKALTMAGDVTAGAVGGSASAESSGGDIRIDGVKGSLEARTAGGDVIVPSIGGSADVETGGGDVRLGFSVRQASIAVRSAGGDVTLTFPRDFRGDFELVVSGSSPDETAIRSDFPEISVTKRPGSQQASGAVNGGGSKVVVRTSSGTIRIRKS